MSLILGFRTRSSAGCRFEKPCSGAEGRPGHTHVREEGINTHSHETGANSIALEYVCDVRIRTAKRFGRRFIGRPRKRQVFPFHIPVAYPGMHVFRKDS